jgi:hypothetical protein
MKKRYLFGLSAMLLALVLMFSGCELLDGLLGGDDDPQTTTYDPIIIDGSDAQNNNIRVKFTKAGSTKAAAWTPASNDNYEISKGSTVLSSGTITLNGSTIVFNPTSGSGSVGTGTYNGGQDLAFTMPGVVVGFYKPGITKVATPVASSTAAQNDKAKPDDIVTLSCDTSDAVIRYTIGDSLPNSASDVYTKGTTVIKVEYPDGKPFIVNAIATKGDMAQSDPLKIPYSNNAESPSFSPASSDIQDGGTVTLQTSTQGATIYYAFTKNESTPPKPTIKDTAGEKNGVFYGSGNGTGTNIVFPVDANTITISAIAYKEGMTINDVASTRTYNKKKGSANDVIKDQFGAGGVVDVVEPDKDGITKIYISGNVRAAKDIPIETKTVLIIGRKKPTDTNPDGDEAQATLTVDAGRTITVSGDNASIEVYGDSTLDVAGSVNIGSKGKLDIKSKGTLSVSGGVTVLSGGVLNITVGTDTGNKTTIEGSGTITVKGEGKMFIPNIKTGSENITLTGITGAIEVEKDGELYLVGKDDANKDVWWPWIGTAKSKGIDPANEVGADYVITSGKITLKGSDPASNGTFVPYMFLYGNATVLGIEKYPKPTTPVREPVALPYMFTVNDGYTLTIGDVTTGTAKPSSTLIVSSSSPTISSKLINLGTVILNKDSVIKATSASDIIGKVLDEGMKEIQFKQLLTGPTTGPGWENPTPTPPK